MVYRHVILLLLTSCLLSLTACKNDAPYTDDIDTSAFFLSFTVTTRTITRAEENQEDADFPTQIGTLPENYINVNDIRYALFDEEGNFISDLTPEASIKAINDDFTVYEVTAKITAPYFEEHINDFINFYVLVIANFTPWGLTLSDLHSGTSLAEFFNSDFSMSTIPDVDRLLAPPGSEDSLPFPMAGIQYFSINGRNLLNTTPSEPFNLSLNAWGKTVNMLRAISKIEIIDKINLPDNTVFDESLTDQPLRITGASLEGFFNRGTVLPAFSQWHISDMVETQQVTAPTIPGNAVYQLPPPLNPDNTITPAPALSDYSLPLRYDATATAARADKCPVYSCYTFEYSRQALSGVEPAQYPYLKISLQGSDVDPDKSHPVDIPFRLPAYYTDTDGGRVATPILALLRNYIYRYEITGVSHLLKFDWTVCPMDKVVTDISFN